VSVFLLTLQLAHFFNWVRRGGARYGMATKSR
jgi:hypothetical protein